MDGVWSHSHVQVFIRQSHANTSASVLSYPFANNSFANSVLLSVLVIFHFSFLSNIKKFISRFPLCIDDQ